VLLIALTLLGAVIEITGGYLSSSLSLDADAIHLIADSGFYALAWWEDSLHAKSQMNDLRMRRISRVAASLLFCTGIAMCIFAEHKMRTGGAQVEGLPMLVASVLGLSVNVWMHRILDPLHQQHKHQDRDGLRAALEHNVRDLWTSIGVVVTAFLILVLSYLPFIPYITPAVPYLDSIVGLMIGLQLMGMGYNLWLGKKHVH